MESGKSCSCPRCREPLVAERLDEPPVTLDVLMCSRCHGRFLSQAQMGMIEETVAPRLLEVRRIPASLEQQISLSCPACSPIRTMEKLEHHRDKKVTVDQCPECQGIWLDGGELEAIQRESLPVFLANTVRYFWGLLD